MRMHHTSTFGVKVRIAVYVDLPCFKTTETSHTQGSIMTYRLLGMVLASAEQTDSSGATANAPKENGVNDAGSLLTHKLVTGGPAPPTLDASAAGPGGQQTSAGGVPNNNAGDAESTKKKKSRMCNIM
jgi:hypothetical protein